LKLILCWQNRYGGLETKKILEVGEIEFLWCNYFQYAAAHHQDKAMIWTEWSPEYKELLIRKNGDAMSARIKQMFTSYVNLNPALAASRPDGPTGLRDCRWARCSAAKNTKLNASKDQRGALTSTSK
jgi:hypothetical protein